MQTHSIGAALDSTFLGPAISFENLTLFPLMDAGKDRARLDYATLDDALRQGHVEITEVSEQGSVPDLRVVNRGPIPTLIVDGEELLGAKQNRIVNLTILVPAGARLTIPVSCVEAGRWSPRSRAFSAAPRAQHATGRAKRMRHVTESLAARGDRMSDQADVWADIAEKSARLNADSPTAAMEAMFTGHAVTIDGFVEACGPIEGQVGALFAINGRIAGLELCDRSDVLHKLLPKIVRSYAIDAIDARTGLQARRVPDIDGAATARQFMEFIPRALVTTAPAIGAGTDVRLTGAGVTGAALVVDDHMVHLTAFADA